ncbi:MAG: hypothetical protein KGO81_11825 [Bacteroidota bacterium]|nr:hypothetical protein [Bacteroidota bacterium]
MKKTIVALALIFAVYHTEAQRRNIPPTYSDNPSGEPAAAESFDGSGFKKEHVFVGGSLALGLSNYTFNLGGTPEIGYSISKWLDAGLAVNLNYQSVRADPYYNNNVRQRSFNYGGGPFVRLYPVNFLFVQTQFEANWIKYNFMDMNSNTASSLKTSSSSLLAGIGYSQRIIGQSSFYTLVMIDLKADPYSPYRDYNGQVIPIIRAGFNFYLHPSKK